jgi:phosphohistidine phosphatase
MTLRLILIRHAKSSWDDPLGDDHSRVLNTRGRRSATAIGAWLASRGYLPDVVLCSNAARTAQTLELILPALPVKPKTIFLSSLYHASPDGMLATLHKATAPVVALIGHNPGIGGLAGWLVRSRPADPRYSDYPTGATAIIDFDAKSWTEAAPGTGRVTDFVTPRELIGGESD